MSRYQRPVDNFFILPNSIFNMGLTPIPFSIYAYLVCCSGSKGYCWPRQETICNKTGIGISSVQKHLKLLEQRQMIAISKHRKERGYPNNKYILLSLDNPEIYRDLTTVGEPEVLPLYIEEPLPT